MVVEAAALEGEQEREARAEGMAGQQQLRLSGGVLALHAGQKVPCPPPVVEGRGGELLAAVRREGVVIVAAV